MDITKLKPSELIRVALEDLRLCEADPRYRICMDVWHIPVNDKCEVCLGGAVMAQHIGVAVDAWCEVYDFSDTEITDALLAIDYFRVGHVTACLNNVFGVMMFSDDMDRPITPYEKDPIQFETDMLQLASDLEEEGY